MGLQREHLRFVPSLLNSCLCALSVTGTVSSGALEIFSDGIDNLLIGIELDFHIRHLFLDCGFIIPQDTSFLCDEVTLIKKNVP